MSMENFDSNEGRIPGMEVGEAENVTPEELTMLNQLSGSGKKAHEDDGTALEDATERMEGKNRKRNLGNEYKKAA